MLKKITSSKKIIKSTKPINNIGYKTVLCATVLKCLVNKVTKLIKFLFFLIKELHSPMALLSLYPSYVSDM